MPVQEKIHTIDLCAGGADTREVSRRSDYTGYTDYFSATREKFVKLMQ